LKINIFLVFVIGIITAFFLIVIKVVKPGQDLERKLADKRNSAETEIPRLAKSIDDYTLLGYSGRRAVMIPNDLKHFLVCGTTGTGKTVALSCFIRSGGRYKYPMLIVDGKGDTGMGSILDIVNIVCPYQNKYIINFNDPASSDKYNPFKNTTPDIIKDMLMNLTTFSEEHYRYNTERYLGRVITFLCLKQIPLSLKKIIEYIPIVKFIALSKELLEQGIITKETHADNIEVSKTSGEIASGAVARFAVIAESNIGVIFAEEGIDIYTAIEEKAIIVFILNPLSYPEMSSLLGKLIVIDSKKCVANLFAQREKSRTFFLFDEINVYASTSFLDLVNKSRSAGVTCFLSAQSLSDLNTVSAEFRNQVIENCNNYVVLRQNNAENADIWANTLGTFQTLDLTYQVKDGDTSGMGSLRSVREFTYHPEVIKNLKQGEAIFLSKDMGTHAKIKIHKGF
jgi:hypothetical protein